MSSAAIRCSTTLLLTALLLTAGGCGGPPQVVANEECFSAVDALWTAVTSKRSDLVEQTATELDRLQTEGSLSDEGHARLAEIIEVARAEKWQDAAVTLKAFMLGQRKQNSQ